MHYGTHTAYIVAATNAPPPVPQFSPAELPGLTGWYDAQSPQTVTLEGNAVTAIANRVAGPDLTAVPEGGPEYALGHSVSHGRPAFVWPDADTKRGLWFDADHMVHDVFMVLAYRDGVDSTFNTYTTMFIDTAGTTDATVNWLVSKSESPGVFAKPPNSDILINGGPATMTLLPLPLSVLHVRSPTPFPLRAIGYKYRDKPRAWRGPICEILTFDAPLVSEGATAITTYLMEKWGI